LANLTQELVWHSKWVFNARPNSCKNNVGIFKGFLMLGQPHARIGWYLEWVFFITLPTSRKNRVGIQNKFLMVGQPHTRIWLAF
jgi:hypothetical protein